MIDEIQRFKTILFLAMFILFLMGFSLGMTVTHFVYQGLIEKYQSLIISCLK